MLNYLDKSNVTAKMNMLVCIYYMNIKNGINTKTKRVLLLWTH